MQRRVFLKPSTDMRCCMGQCRTARPVPSRRILTRFGSLSDIKAINPMLSGIFHQFAARCRHSANMRQNNIRAGATTRPGRLPIALETG